MVVVGLWLVITSLAITSLFCRLKRMQRQVRQVAGEQVSDRILQDPDGVCSAQTARDIKLTIQTLERIYSTLEEITPLLLDSLDLRALATLVVENLCTEMTQGREMPLVLQFAHRFSSAMREYPKRIAKCSFIYYTSPSSYYIKQVSFSSFDQFPSMPRPVRNALVTRHSWQMFGQSLRQQTAWSITTKDSAETLPLNCHETKAGHLKPVDCARLAQTEEEISSDQSSSPEVLICEGSIVYVRRSSQPASNTAITFLSGQSWWEHVCCWEPCRWRLLMFAQDPQLLSYKELLISYKEGSIVS